MKTYKDINEFIIDVFPEDYEKVFKREKTPIQKAIERADNLFAQELEEAIKGKEEIIKQTIEKSVEHVDNLFAQVLEDTLKGKKEEKKE
jgi:phosphate uptake regulator